MERLEEMVADLIEKNARHRSGFRLADATYAGLIENLKKEIDELADALEGESRENQVDEFGDVEAIIVHLRQKARIEASEVEEAAIAKLAIRFTKENHQ